MSAPSLAVSKANLCCQRIAGAALCALLLIGIGAESGAGQSSTEAPYQVVDVQSGGSISGTVKWSGPVPKIPRLPITKDLKICDPAGENGRDLQRLIIGSEGGVAIFRRRDNWQPWTGLNFEPDILDQLGCSASRLWIQLEQPHRGIPVICLRLRRR